MRDLVHQKDGLAAYHNFADSHVQKPIDYDHFVAASRELGLYWPVLKLPPPRRAG